MRLLLLSRFSSILPSLQGALFRLLSKATWLNLRVSKFRNWNQNKLPALYLHREALETHSSFGCIKGTSWAPGHHVRNRSLWVAVLFHVPLLLCPWSFLIPTVGIWEMTDPLSRWTLEKRETPRDVFPSPEDALQTLPSALTDSTERANMFPSMPALYCCGVLWY